MADNTKIEWCDASWNPIRARNRESGKVGWFCVHASAGCKFCYAESINRRLGTGVDYKAQNLSQVELVLDENMLIQPLRWKKPRVVFVCSMTDLFGEFVPDEFIDRVFAIMALCPQHVFIVLTKRSSRMRGYFSDRAARNAAIGRQVNELSATHVLLAHALPLRSVWLGISAEDQARLDERWADLRDTPAIVRLLSLEPLLGRIDLARCLAQRRPDWVIVGGESGPHARPMHPDWARSLRDQCAAAGVAFFFKQWGEWREVDGPKTTAENRDMSAGTHWLTRDGTLHADGSRRFSIYHDYLVARFGKKAAGRLLDGRAHDERPPFLSADAPQELFS